MKLSSLIIFASIFQCTVYAQEESAPQIRLSTKGLAYVNLSTSPANPVSGQPTIILIQFLDPQSKAPRGDIYYRLVIRNETSPIFVMPGGSTIAGKVGIPYQFDNPGNYQVEVDLNDTDISKATTAPLDKVTFPIYVTKGEPQEDNQTTLNTTQGGPPVNTGTVNTDNGHFLVDAALAAVAAGLAIFIVRRRINSRQRGSLSE